MSGRQAGECLPRPSFIGLALALTLGLTPAGIPPGPHLRMLIGRQIGGRGRAPRPAPPTPAAPAPAAIGAPPKEADNRRGAGGVPGWGRTPGGQAARPTEWTLACWLDTAPACCRRRHALTCMLERRCTRPARVAKWLAVRARGQTQQKLWKGSNSLAYVNMLFYYLLAAQLVCG